LPNILAIKLERTDTTLDLSQKAEKVWLGRFVVLLKMIKTFVRACGQSHNHYQNITNIIIDHTEIFGILTWRGRGSCSPKRVINKARRLIEYTALHAAVCGRLWLQLRLYVRRIIFVRVGLCACRRPRTQPTNKKRPRGCAVYCLDEEREILLGG